jgi:hypothetical protein
MLCYNSHWRKYKKFCTFFAVGELVGEYENKRKWRNVINSLKSTTYNIIENG